MEDLKLFARLFTTEFDTLGLTKLATFDVFEAIFEDSTQYFIQIILRPRSKVLTNREAFVKKVTNIVLCKGHRYPTVDFERRANTPIHTLLEKSHKCYKHN